MLFIDADHPQISCDTGGDRVSLRGPERQPNYLLHCWAICIQLCSIETGSVYVSDGLLTLAAAVAPHMHECLEADGGELHHIHRCELHTYYCRCTYNAVGAMQITPNLSSPQTVYGMNSATQILPADVAAIACKQLTQTSRLGTLLRHPLVTHHQPI